MVRAVLFDLDDTLFDHHGCARTALACVHQSHACFSAIRFEEFERHHMGFLEALHFEVLEGRLGLDAARIERFRRLFESAGVKADDGMAQAAARTYRDRYLSARRAIAGAAALLPHVHRRARIAVVSNNVLEEQQEKLRHCGLDAHVDELVVSTEVGACKPDPLIFEVALERVGVPAGEAVMIGDSWSADVAGARAVGIRPIWFNRHRQPRPEPGTDVDELHALEPVEPVLAAVFGGTAHGSARDK